MLNLDHIKQDGSATIVVPILPALDFQPEEYAFTLRSMIDNREVSMDFSQDMTVTPNYIAFDVLFNEDAPDGEYAYTLTIYGEQGERQELVSNGLATVGDYTHQVKKHTETIQYQQYGN